MSWPSPWCVGGGGRAASRIDSCTCFPLCTPRPRRYPPNPRARAQTGFGFAILNVLVVDIDPADRVKTAMNEINAAQRMRLAAYEQSEAEKIRIVKAAEADAEAKYLAGQGIARQRQAIVAGAHGWGGGVGARARAHTPIGSPSRGGTWVAAQPAVDRARPSPSAPTRPPPHTLSSPGLRESVQQFQSEVNDVNSREVMNLLVLTQVRGPASGEGAWGAARGAGRLARPRSPLPTPPGLPSPRPPPPTTLAVL